MIESIVRLAVEAGRRIMPIYNGHVQVELKADSSPLTEADRVSHAFLVEELAGMISGCPVISEESAEKPDPEVHHSGEFWLVDPLDGTKEFLKKSGEFTVNIALIREGKPVLGVVHAPATGLTYMAEAGGQAGRLDSSGRRGEVRVRRADPACLSVVASRDHAGPLVQRMLGRLPGARCASIGSSLKFCLVAEGAADIYLRDVPTMEWDTAAAQCIVESAGGRIMNLDGTVLTYGKAGLKNGSLLTLGDESLPWREYLK